MFIFKLLKELKTNSLLSAVYESANCKIELSQDETVIGYVTPDNKGFKIVLNPDKMVNDKMALFVLSHEIMHVYFSHFIIMRPNPKLDNLAKDFAINHYLMDYLSIGPELLIEFGAIFNRTLEKYYGFKNIPEDSDSQAVYEFLKDNESKVEKKPDFKSFCQTDETKNSESRVEALEEKLAEKLSDSDLEELSQLESRILPSESMGHNGLGLSRKIKEIRQGKSSKEIARILLMRVITNNLARFTPKRSSRRDDTIDARIKTKNNKVCFIVDTSGSIGDDELNLINEVILTSSKLASITVRCGDTKLRNEKELRQGEKLSREFFKGGGGTDLNFAKQDNDRFLHYLIFTDGMIPEFNEKFNRTLFIFDGYSMVDGEKCFKLK